MKNLLIPILFLVACNDSSHPGPNAKQSPKDRILIENLQGNGSVESPLMIDTVFLELRKINQTAAHYTDLSRRAYDQMNSDEGRIYGQMANYYNNLYETKYKAYIKNMK